MNDINELIKAIQSFRITEAGLDERQIQEQLHQHLQAKGFTSSLEFSFAPRCRADIWIDGIVIELKKKRPSTAAVMSQLERYARTGKAKGIVLILERSVHIPATMHGVPVRVVSLNSLWGIAL